MPPINFALPPSVVRLVPLRGRVPGILDLSVGANFTDRAQGSTHGLSVILEDQAALEAYLPHPLHVPVAQALRQAVESRRPNGSQLLHHSDRGCQYTSDAYQQTLRTLGIDCSMSRTGCCYDNAVAERFFWSLKHEWTKHQHFHDLEHARLSVFKYIETFYNTERLHQTLGYKSPDKFEAEYAPVVAA